MALDISIVIPFRPQETTLPLVLSSLKNQKDICFEVLVVANPKKPEPWTLPTCPFPVTLLESPKGANEARNCGLKFSKSDLVLFLDSDCYPTDPLFLKNYVTFFRHHPKVTGCGGPYVLPEKSSSFSMTYFYLQNNWIYSGLLNNHFETHHLLGGNLAVRKSSLQGQEFDPSLVFGGTEKEFLVRLVQRGHHFQFLPEQRVVHHSHIGLFDLFKKGIAQGRGAHYIQSKWGNLKREQLYLRTPLQPLGSPLALRIYNGAFQIGKGQSWQQFFLQWWKKKKHRLLLPFFMTRSHYKSDLKDS